MIKVMEQKTILVIEDSLYLAESLQDMIEMQGYKALVAPNGTKGIEIALSEKPDLIFLDIRLPDISGYQVFQSIRADEWGKNAKISILTASESIEEISKNIQLPKEYVLFKPEWSIAALADYIKKRLSS